MARLLPPDSYEQTIILKDVLRELSIVRAYIVGSGSEEFAIVCEMMQRKIANVISGIELALPVEEKEE